MNRNFVTILGAVVLLAGLVIYLKVWGSQEVPSNPDSLRLLQYNISVLLDLSNRIDPTKAGHQNQAGKDKQIIRHTVSFFEQEVRRKLYVNSRDTLRILIASQPTDYQGLIPEFADKLRIDMSEMSPAERRDRLPKAIETLLAQVDKLYVMAQSSAQFVGADIWSFFRTNLEDYIAKPMDDADQVQNVLIILTDGYIDFDRSIQTTRPTEGNRTSYMLVRKFANDLKGFDAGDHGLIPIRKDAFKSLEVLVLEMTEREIGDQAILEKYWAKWLTEMDVKRFSLKMTHDSPAQVGEIIEQFLLSN